MDAQTLSDTASELANPGGTDVADLIDRLCEKSEEGDSDSVSMADLLDAIGARSYGPLLLAIALIVISPVGAIPTVPSLAAVAIALVALQLLIGRKHVWLPQVLRRREVSGDRLRTGIEKMRPVADVMDRWFGKRLSRLTGEPVRRVAALFILALCALVVPLELVPFGAVIPMGAILLFGLAITARDGILMVLAFLASGAALAGGWMLVHSS
ncbi:exopolysaccharide biosynthesis protein [Litorisediminicola beolgyonensis]|uniref:Exopolysaccharide biosynthesis protein n=1 Tax=Litorisediminicola beolgyonensis TaxID=1173614 RepID=A0ABW3ZCL0_9RHOB